MKATETKFIDGNYYCVYCCKIAKYIETGSYHHNTLEDVYFCECETAKRELQMNKQIDIIKDTFSDVEPNFKGLKRLEFEIEVRKLKCKYGV